MSKKELIIAGKQQFSAYASIEVLHGSKTMSEKIGRFEIQSQLAQSQFATIYKALDTESQQTVALKVVRLDRVRDRAALTKLVFAEAEQAKPLNSPNITGLYGVGDENDLLLAAMEYIQGVSVATTLSRHDGFSIWDLQDIARQVCHALDHANVHRVVHQSLEPAKIMVQWDGLTKVLAFGSSLLNSQAMETAGVPEVLRYASPEQLRGEQCDIRSEIFSLGAILYEMATEQQAFPGETEEQVRTAILESTPPLPHRLKPNVNQALSALIMRSMAKAPADRYQSGQDLIRDLEQCKGTGSAIGAQPAQAVAPKVAAPSEPKAWPKAAAAAAGVGNSSVASPKASAASAAAKAKPSFAVDPMMAGDGGGATNASFSDVSELPPLKEAYVAPPPPPSAEEDIQLPEPLPTGKKAAQPKPKVDFGATARKAVYAIKRTPPKWYLYSVTCAVFFIALYIAGMSLYNHFQDRDTNGTPAVVPLVPDQPTATQSQNTPPADQPAPEQASQPLEAPDTQPAQTADSQPDQPATAAGRRGSARKTISRPIAAIVPGQLSVNSTPAGAKVSFDGSELCQTPCTLTGIAPGQHTVTASKAGFATATRNLAMLSGANSTVALDLSPLGTTLSVNSTPAGAVILLDGKDTGKLTPSQFAISKSGSHTITLQRAGYLDGSNTVQIETGQAANVNLALTHLGNTEEIRSAGGHFKKVFGGNNGEGMGIVSIKTQPKGAQIMVNNRVLDKTSPFDFYLNPGTYVIDITMSGYQPLHRVIAIQEGEKVAIQETLSASGN